MRILLVEDNESLGKYVVQALKEASYAVDWCKDGEQGERSAKEAPPDLVLLDVMLPKRDGFAVCRGIRGARVDAPILMLTALGETDDRVQGLDCGADDYLVKPFAMEELLARVRALLRRPAARLPEVLTVQDLELRPAEHTVHKGGRALTLTHKQFAVLEYLMRNAGQVLSRTQILEHCWDYSYDAASNITDVYIRQLRATLNDTDERYIETVRGAGYRLRP